MIFAAYSERSSEIPCGPNTRWNAAKCSGSLSTSVPSRSNSSAVFMTPGRIGRGLRSHRCSDLPGREFGVAIAQELGLGPLARSDRKDLVEDFPALLRNRHAVDDVAAIDVHILDHPAVGVIVGGEFYRRRRFAAVSRAPTSGEAEHIGAARDLPGRRHG